MTMTLPTNNMLSIHASVLQSLLSINLSVLRPVHVNTGRINRGVKALSKFGITTINDFVNASPLHLIDKIPQFGAGCYEEICASIDSYLQSVNINVTFAELYHSINLQKELERR